MEIIALSIFVIGYLAIAFEHTIHLNKTVSALICGVLCWTVYALYTHHPETVTGELSHHLADIAEIVFFLLGAMTIVELVDAHHGFKIITDRIRTRDTRALLWIISFIAFFMSAILDNLTTSIVMVSLLRKLIDNKSQRMFYACIVIIAANSGGAWSPLGDVTTTMLWIDQQITSANIIKQVFMPSLFSLLVPLIYLSLVMKGKITPPGKNIDEEGHISPISARGSTIMLIVGVGILLFVPVFKTVTHLPPYMGMMLGLALIWLVSEVLHRGKDEEARRPFSASYALSRIDSASVLFFLGILLAVTALESMHLLHGLATWMNQTIGNMDVIVVLTGIASSVVDNVPLVAAMQGMYDLNTYPTDHRLWELLAYCAGTGGSILIIGSAAGVAVMGMEQISFGWYLKKISLLAIMGYFAGIIVYMLLNGWMR